MADSRHLLLLDASGFAYRAYHSGANPVYRQSDGQPIGAILGFMGMVWRLLGAAQADQPTHGAAVFDPPGKTFRHRLFPAYKADRPHARTLELLNQFQIMRHASEVLGLRAVEAEGFEADDVIATLADWAVAAGWRVTIVSSDKDMAQLVRDGAVEIVDPVTKKRILEADVRKRFGVPPKLVPEVQALCGDAVDGIPGVDGIGMKKAGALIRHFGSLKALMEAVSTRRHFDIEPAARVALRRAAEATSLYRRLATLRRTVPVKIELDALGLRPIEKSHVMALLKALEAEPRFEAMFESGQPKLQRFVEPVSDRDAYAWWREELRASGQVIPEEPQCGFYRRRMVRGGVFVPVRIWREADIDFDTGAATAGRQRLLCMVGSELRDPVAEWGYVATQPIKEAEYRFEVADGEWAKRFAPKDPKANPRKPVDLLAVPAPMYRRRARA